MNKILLHTAAFTALFFPTFLLAQSAIGLENPIGVDSISGLITIVVKVIRYIAIPFVVIMIMYAGFLYIMAGAFEKSGWKLDDAKKAIWWVVIGAFVILSAEMIAIVIENTLKSISR